LGLFGLREVVMKKIAVIAIILIVLLSGCTIWYKYSRSKFSDINYTAERYITTGIFNKYKLYKVNDMTLSFSASNIAVMTVSGLSDVPPHNNVTYRIFLEKNKSGLWKVVKLYTE
jgi:hypothetical protein